MVQDQKKYRQCSRKLMKELGGIELEVEVEGRKVGGEVGVYLRQHKENDRRQE